MTIDKNMFSDEQAVTATAASTNVIDFGADLGNIGDGQSVRVYAQVVVDFATLTSLTVALQTSAVEGSGYYAVLTGPTVVLADLVAGKVVLEATVPKDMLQYCRLYYTVAGSSATAGKVTAGLMPVP